MRFFRPDRPWRYRIAVVVSVTLAAILGGRQLWPRTEEQKVRDVVEDVIDAVLDGDCDDLWDLQTTSTRDDLAIWMKGMLATDPLDPESKAMWRELERRTGLGRGEIQRLSPRDLYGALNSDAELAREFADLEFVSIRIEGDRATVVCSGPLIRDLWFYLEKEEGEWLLDFISRVGEFKTLERKMAASLPKGAVDPRSVDLVVEVGPTGVDTFALSVARARVREMAGGGEHPSTAVIDASPDVSWGDCIRVYDALVQEGVVDVRFAVSGERGYAPGVRVLAPPHPSIDRILGVGEPR